MLLDFKPKVLNDRQWMLLYSKPRHELKLSKKLSDMGFETYCPTVKSVRQWSDRKKKIEEPLFKSYVFAKLKDSEREQVFFVPGFSRFVFWLGKPVIVRECEITATKNFLAKVVHDSIRVKQLQVGDNVHVAIGPLKNVEGKLLRIQGQQATLQIDTLGTIVQAKIALADLIV